VDPRLRGGRTPPLAGSAECTRPRARARARARLIASRYVAGYRGECCYAECLAAQVCRSVDCSCLRYGSAVPQVCRSADCSWLRCGSAVSRMQVNSCAVQLSRVCWYVQHASGSYNRVRARFIARLIARPW
jgi:hypothetical protein